MKQHSAQAVADAFNQQYLIGQPVIFIKAGQIVYTRTTTEAQLTDAHSFPVVGIEAAKSPIALPFIVPVSGHSGGMVNFGSFRLTAQLEEPTERTILATSQLPQTESEVVNVHSNS